MKASFTISFLSKGKEKEIKLSEACMVVLIYVVRPYLMLVTVFVSRVIEALITKLFIQVLTMYFLQSYAYLSKL